jgi:hypothetical protein
MEEEEEEEEKHYTSIPSQKQLDGVIIEPTLTKCMRQLIT